MRTLGHCTFSIETVPLLLENPVPPISLVALHILFDFFTQQNIIILVNQSVASSQLCEFIYLALESSTGYFFEGSTADFVQLS